ncbi:D-tyrosyl-tRNA(Tyr) deacylase [candidate division WOR-3 bacterium]|nr:D-tyrosyl-tRNA(Tyr) deacylase [candidate division WOR-3 bacterium]
MRALLQRVSRAAVRVDGGVEGEIGPGLLVLLGVGHDDSEATCRRLASQVARLRVFDDGDGKMNLSLLDTGGSALVVSQFTLYADTGRGLRPSFTGACGPGRARELYERFVAELAETSVPTRTGRFGARMDVELVNAGPVTIMLDTVGGPTATGSAAGATMEPPA